MKRIMLQEGCQEAENTCAGTQHQVSRLEPSRVMLHCIKAKSEMNSITAQEHHVLDLVDIIDFKWLMSHEGHHVHVERLQTDREYASQCVAVATASTVEALQQSASRIARSLSL